MTVKITATLAAALGLAFACQTVAAEEILIGSQLPMSGALAQVGVPMNEGVMVAAELFNQKNTRHKIRIITVDDESTPAKGVAAVEKLASQGVAGIVGGYGSSIVGPSSDAANKAGLTYITSGALDSSLTGRGLKTFFRINRIDSYSQSITGLIRETGIKSVSIIYSTKGPTTEMARDLEKTLPAMGVKVTLHSFDPALTDFKPVINKIKLQDKPEAIVMAAYENDYVGILRAAKVLRPNVKAVVGTWVIASAKMAIGFPDLMPGVYGPALLPYPVTMKNEEGKQFVAAFRKMFNKEPDYLAEYGYVQSQLMFTAAVRAADKGTLKTGGVSDEVRKASLDTLLGKMQFDDKGDVIGSVAMPMAQHQKGKVAIVWPKAAANARMNFPAVPW